MTTKPNKKHTQKALAAKLGISPQLVSYHVKSGCTVPLNDVDGWRDFFAEIGREGSLPEKLRKEIGQARARLLRAQAERAERENKIAAGELILAADVILQCNQAGGFFCAELDRWAREFPPLAAGRDCAAIAQLLDLQIERTRAELKVKLANIGT
jgi:hypothetical protein